MNLQDVQNRIQVLLTQWVGEIKAETDFGQNDKKVISEIVLMGLLRETHGYKHLKTMNANAGFNYPGIDLADEQARVAIQVTATSSSAKILHTLEEFLKFEQYKSFDRLIVYILTEKQQSYSSKDLLAKVDELKQKQQAQGLEEAIFDLKRDVWDSSDLKHTIAAMQIEQAERVLEILEKNFGLRSSRKARNVPYSTAPELNRYVPREHEYEQIKQALLNNHETSAVGIQGTAALRGTGGFGKTTLAKAICADEEVRTAFPDGIYWLQLNEHATRDAALGKLNDFLRWLDPNQDTVGTIETARAAVKQVLSILRVLLVIDDAWTRSALEPCEGLGCSTLVTTRHPNVLPTGCQTVTVDAMRLVEAVETLLLGLKQAPAEVQRLRQPLDTLAELVGHWPVLLGLINAWIRKDLTTGLSLEASINTIEELLEQGGITILDDLADPESRHKAVTFTVQASLERLPNLPGVAGRARDRFVQLAIFPEDINIPLEVLASLWDLNPMLTQRACDVFWDAGLLVERTTQSIRLHDVIRKYLIDAHKTELPLWHTKLLEACRPTSNRWADLPRENTYLWRWLPDHLEGVGLIDELRTIAFDFEFLQAKLEVLNGDVNAVMDGVAKVSDPASNLLVRTLRLSAHVLGRSPEQLAFQLVGRLIGYVDPDQDLGLATILNKAKMQLRSQGFESVVEKPFLNPPGSLVRTIEIEGEILNLTEVNKQKYLLMCTMGIKYFPNSKFNGKIFMLKIDSAEIQEYKLDRNFINIDNRNWINEKHYICTHGLDIKILDLETNEVKFFQGHTHNITQISIIDENRIVSVSIDHTVRIWNLLTGKTIFLGKHKNSIDCVMVLDDRRIVSGDSDGFIKIWDLANKSHDSLRERDQTILYLAKSGIDRIACGFLGDGVQVWDLMTKECVNFEIPSGSVSALFFLNPDLLAVGSTSGEISIWNLEFEADEYDSSIQYFAARKHRILVGNTSTIRYMTIFDEFHLLSSSDSGINLWDLRIDEIDSKIGHICSKSIKLLPTLDTMITNPKGGIVEYHNLKSGTVKILTGHQREIWAAMQLDQYRIVTASGDSTIRLWDTKTGISEVFIGHEAPVTCITKFDNDYILSGSGDHTVRMWSLKTQKSHIFLDHDKMVNAVIVLDDKKIVTSSDDRAAILWDIESEEMIDLNLNIDLQDNAYRRHINLAKNKEYKKYSNLTGVLYKGFRFLGHNGDVDCITEVNGNRIVSGSADGDLRIWSTSSNLLSNEMPSLNYFDQILHEIQSRDSVLLRGHSGPVRSVLKLNNDLLISGSIDRTLRIWNYNNYVQARILEMDTPIDKMYLIENREILVIQPDEDRLFLFRLVGPLRPESSDDS
jgi:WD40 repeat protein